MGNTSTANLRKEFVFDDKTMAFYGLVGEEGNWGNIGSLGVIKFDKDCVEEQKELQGYDFSWTRGLK